MSSPLSETKDDEEESGAVPENVESAPSNELENAESQEEKTAGESPERIENES